MPRIDERAKRTRSQVASVLAKVLAVVSVAACSAKLATEVSDAGLDSSMPDIDAGDATSAGDSGAPDDDGAADGNASDGAVDADVVDAVVCPAPPIHDGGGCEHVWHYPCGPFSEGGTRTLAECQELCMSTNVIWCRELDHHTSLPLPAYECKLCSAGGRRPDGYRGRSSKATIAEWFAQMADLERVSVDAFQTLQRELAHHGAPEDLVLAAERAEQDEVRHARTLAALALREGAELSTEAVKHGDVRALVDIAIENGVEGCIRETYGALVASWQSTHAKRLDVRRVMKTIAREETEHAELAWAVHAWAMARLEPAERTRVIAAMEAAARSLLADAQATVGMELVVELGLPSSMNARRLVRELDAHLWETARAA